MIIMIAQDVIVKDSKVWEYERLEEIQRQKNEKRNKGRTQPYQVARRKEIKEKIKTGGSRMRRLTEEVKTRLLKQVAYCIENRGMLFFVSNKDCGMFSSATVGEQIIHLFKAEEMMRIAKKNINDACENEVENNFLLDREEHE